MHVKCSHTPICTDSLVPAPYCWSYKREANATASNRNKGKGKAYRGKPKAIAALTAKVSA